jgi:hypothetical protein
MSQSIQFGTVDSVLASRSNLKTKVLHLPNWGGYFIIMEMTGKARDAYEAELMTVSGKGRNQTVKPDWRNSRAKLVAKHIVDPSAFDVQEVVNPEIWERNYGEPQQMMVSTAVEYRATLKDGHTPKLLFNSIQVNDLGDTDATTLQLVYDECRELSGISEKDIEELEGELKNGQNADYGSN